MTAWVAGGWKVEETYLPSNTLTTHDQPALRITHFGFFEGYALSVEEMKEKIGPEWVDLKEVQ